MTIVSSCRHGELRELCLDVHLSDRAFAGKPRLWPSDLTLDRDCLRANDTMIPSPCPRTTEFYLFSLNEGPTSPKDCPPTRMWASLAPRSEEDHDEWRATVTWRVSSQLLRSQVVTREHHFGASSPSAGPAPMSPVNTERGGVQPNHMDFKNFENYIVNAALENA